METIRLKRTVDVVVVGGGPAGCAAAIELSRRGYSVAVLERRRPNHRAHGDTLGPECAPWLQRLRVWDLFQQLRPVPSPGTVCCWENREPAARDHMLSPYGCGWHVDRQRFDSMMREAAGRAGALIVWTMSPIRVLPRCQGLWTLLFKGEHGLVELQSRQLIDATGKRRSLLKQFGVRTRKLDCLVGVISVLRSPCSPDRRLFLEATQNGWWYYARLPDEQAIVAMLTDGDMAGRLRRNSGRLWHQELQQTRLISALVGNAAAGSSLSIVSANTSIADSTGGAGWIAVGDAAASLDPLSGQGIYSALRSGCRGAACIHECLAGRLNAVQDFQQWVAEEFAQHIAQQSRYYQRVGDWNESRFWLRRHRAASEQTVG